MASKTDLSKFRETMRSQQAAALRQPRPCERKVTRTIGGGVKIRARVIDRSPIGGLFEMIGA